MNALRALLILLGVLALAGCEGGIGGTGTGAPAPGGATGATGSSAPFVLVSGQGNKGPFTSGSTVTAHLLSGIAQDRSTVTHLALGEFQLELRTNAEYRLGITGRYFSELEGQQSVAPVTLIAIVRAGSADGANINLATHIAHLRILQLKEDGIGLDAAMDMAATELTAALAPVIRAPAHTTRLGRLVVLNRAQRSTNREGNAWLLALTSLIEHAATQASVASGNSPEVELSGLCDRLAYDFADDGVIGAALLGELYRARIGLDPDAVAGHLLNYAITHSDALQSQAVGGMDTADGSVDAAGRMCTVFGSQIVCATTTQFPHGSRHQVMMQLSGMGGANITTGDLETEVANMNRFIDTDDDGVVNADDEDDDGDGVADEDDPTPYGM